jgi:phospholipid/cholesterol/gamma-HCH transport system substrate-binding protein
MAKRKGSDLIAGVIVLAVAVGFLGYALAHTGRGGGAGYTLHARFDRIDGLSTGSDVRLAGVTVGSVTGDRIDPKTYQAVVDFTVSDSIELPKDSSAVISSDGLLGGKYLSLEPGGDTEMLKPGGQITLTQSSISIEQLLGKFIFSAGNLSGQKPADGSAPAAAAPSPAPAPAK